MIDTEIWILYHFHVSQNIFYFPQPFKNVKTILNSWTMKRQMVGQFWPMGHSLLTLLQAVLHRNKSHLYSVSCHLLSSFPNYWNGLKNSKNLPLCSRSFSFLHKTWGHWVFFLGLLFISVGSQFLLHCILSNFCGFHLYYFLFLFLLS